MVLSQQQRIIATRLIRRGACAAFAPQTRVHAHKRKSRTFTPNILGWLVFMGSLLAPMSSTIAPACLPRSVEVRHWRDYRDRAGVAFAPITRRQGLLAGGRFEITSAMVMDALQTRLTAAKLGAPHGEMEARQTGFKPGAHWIYAQSAIVAPVCAGVRPFGKAEKHDDADV